MDGGTLHGRFVLRTQGKQRRFVEDEHVPAVALMVVEHDRAVDALALLLDLVAVIDAAQVLHEDIEHSARANGHRRLKDMRLKQLAVVERDDRLPVEEDLRAVVRADKLEAAQLALVDERRAVERVADVLPKALHALRRHMMMRRARGGQREQRRGGEMLRLAVAGARDFRNLDRRNGSALMRLDGGLEEAVFFRLAAILAQRGVVVVARRVRRQAVIVVAAVHQAEARAAVEHVDVDVAEREQVGKVLRADSGVGRAVPAAAPVVKPAAPELHAHQRLDAVRGHDGEALLRLRAEVAGLEDALRAAAGEHVVLRAVGGEERHVDAALCHRVAQRGQVGLVVAVGAVFVLDLHHQHGAAVGHLQRNQARDQLVVVGEHVLHIGRIAAAQPHAVLLEQPGREAAELPFAADVGRRAEDDVEPNLLRQAHERGHVAPAAEVKLTPAALMEVPGNVGLHGVAAHGLELEEPVAPVLRHDAEIMDGAGDDLEPFSVEVEVVADFKRAHTLPPIDDRPECGTKE